MFFRACHGFLVLVRDSNIEQLEKQWESSGRVCFGFELLLLCCFVVDTTVAAHALIRRAHSDCSQLHRGTEGNPTPAR